MKVIAINGYNSYIGNIFYSKYKNKTKIIKFKKDINNFSLIKKFIDKNKFTHFIHLAGLSRQKCDKYKKKCIKTNYLSIKKIIDYLNKTKSKTIFIFISSSHVYSSSKKKLKENCNKMPNNCYGKLKLLSENYIKKNYKNYCILRLFNVFGTNQPSGFFIPDIKNKIKNKSKIMINNSKRDFINVKEVVKIINFIIFNNMKGIFNVGTGISYDLKKIVKQIARKYKAKPILTVKNYFDKIVSNISLLEKSGYKFSKYGKYLNI